MTNHEPRTTNHTRRIAAFACLFIIVVLRIEPQLLRLPFMDRTTFNQQLAERADGEWRQYPLFLDGVRQHTRPGEKIAIVVPPNKWDDGYSYAYYRAAYFLAGREVLPLITEDDRFHPENVRAAEAIASWHMRTRPGESGLGG